MKAITFEDLAKFVPTYVPILIALKEGISFEGDHIPYSTTGGQIDGFVNRLSEGRFTVQPLYCGISVNVETLLRQRFINEETLVKIEQAQKAATEKQARLESLDRACSSAEAQLEEAEKLAKKVGQAIMKEAIERLRAILDERKTAYKDVAGEDWCFDPLF
jgi:hypothetical protein